MPNEGDIINDTTNFNILDMLFEIERQEYQQYKKWKEEYDKKSWIRKLFSMKPITGLGANYRKFVQRIQFCSDAYTRINKLIGSDLIDILDDDMHFEGFQPRRLLALTKKGREVVKKRRNMIESQSSATSDKKTE